MENVGIVSFITVTTLAHGALFAYDDYILHKRRGLCQKQANLYLFDGVFFLATVTLTLFTKFTQPLATLYVVLAILSCLSIIKNEFFYKNLDLKERLTHAGLYVLHPLILYAFYASWKINLFHTNMTYWMLQLCYLIFGVKAMSYHVIYWNYIAKVSCDE